MNELEKQLLTQETAGRTPTLVVRSRTRIDTGRWWWPSPVWLIVLPDELLMLAVSRRRYVEKSPLAACDKTHYSHMTGELVVEPSEGLLYSRFRVTPKQALQLLEAMGLPQLDSLTIVGKRSAPAPDRVDDIVVRSAAPISSEAAATSNESHGSVDRTRRAAPQELGSEQANTEGEPLC